MRKLILAIALLPALAFGASDYKKEAQEIQFEKSIAFLKRDESSGATVNALISTSSFIKLTATVSTINGMVSPTSPLGRYVLIRNATGADVTVSHESASASAGNRFDLPDDADLELPVDAVAAFIYDQGSSRWVSAGGSGGGVTFTAIAPIDYDDITEQLTCDVASGSQPGCLSAAKFTDFDATFDDVSLSTALNTASRLVRRDGSGNFAAGTITASLSGNATTASALAANGTNCSSGNYPLGVDASGNAESCSPAGTGDVTGPASSTDNAIARFDSTTGKLIQNSVVTVGDTGIIAGATLPAASVSYTPTTSANWISVPTQGQEALDNLAAQRPVINLMSDFEAYTPAITGFGTVSGVACEWARDGQNLILNCKFTSGTPSASQGRIPLPSGITVDSSLSTVSRVGGCGLSATSSFVCHALATGGTDYVAIGAATIGSGTAALATVNADAYIGSGTSLSLNAIIPIAEWAQSTTVDIFEAGDFGWTTFTPVWGPLSGFASSSGRYRRVGDTMEVEATFIKNGSNGTGASALTLDVPGGLLVDSAKLSDGTGGQAPLGYVTSQAAGDANARQAFLNGTQISFRSGLASTYQGNSINANNTFNVRLWLPIQGWSTFPIGVAAASVGDHEIILSGGNGNGSTDTVVQRYANVLRNVGTAITYADSATAGTTLTINQDGLYSIMVNRFTPDGASAFGASVNYSPGSTGITATPDGNVLGISNGTGTVSGSLTVVGRFSNGDVIRPQHGGNTTPNNSQQRLRIVKIGN